MLLSVLAISVGASLGAIARWLLGSALNTVLPAIPMGTLAANLIGGYLIGLSLAVFAAIPSLSAEWRLFIITGFLGGLTTFSTFSAEIVALFQQGRLAMATLAVSLHVGGSLLMTFLGLGTFALLKRL